MLQPEHATKLTTVPRVGEQMVGCTASEHWLTHL